ncbi:hypothetical protein ACFL6U_28525, partial [Planctomycetota bacterium]
QVVSAYFLGRYGECHMVPFALDKRRQVRVEEQKMMVNSVQFPNWIVFGLSFFSSGTLYLPMVFIHDT